MPLRPAAGSVTAITIATEAILPEVMNCLAPSIRQPSSVRCARVRMAAASEPGIGLGQRKGPDRRAADQARQPAVALRR